MSCVTADKLGGSDECRQLARKWNGSWQNGNMDCEKTDDVKSECDTDKRGRLPPSESPLASSLEGDTRTVGQLQRNKSRRVVVYRYLVRETETTESLARLLQSKISFYVKRLLSMVNTNGIVEKKLCD